MTLQYAFYTPPLACVKTFVMMIGEMDYSSIFLEHFTSSEYHDVVQYDESSNVVFIIFALFMSLLLTNLLVSVFISVGVEHYVRTLLTTTQCKNLINFQFY